jgi:hypothetical protein
MRAIRSNLQEKVADEKLVIDIMELLGAARWEIDEGGGKKMRANLG